MLKREVYQIALNLKHEFLIDQLKTPSKAFLKYEKWAPLSIAQGPDGFEWHIKSPYF